MRKRTVILQSWVCFALVLANFVAQVPYFLHLYAGTQAFAISLRSFLIIGAVFAVFLAAMALLYKGLRAGYWLALLFLAAEFLFYLLGALESTLHGYGLFFQVYNPDLILRVIYSIGYLNLFASGYFLFLVLRFRHYFLAKDLP